MTNNQFITIIRENTPFDDGQDWEDYLQQLAEDHRASGTVSSAEDYEAMLAVMQEVRRLAEKT